MTNDVSPQILLAALNDVWDRAGAGANSVREQLATDHAAAYRLISSGSIASVGKNSANHTYKSYGPGSVTQTQVVEIIGNLIGLYDQVQAKIKAEFLASADFDHTEPAGFDYDPPVYQILVNVFSQQSSGKAPTLPDIRDLRIPLCVSPCA